MRSSLLLWFALVWGIASPAWGAPGGATAATASVTQRTVWSDALGAKARDLAGFSVECDLPVCRARDQHLVLRRITGLRIGQRLSVEDLAVAWRRLAATRLFRRIEVRIAAHGRGVLRDAAATPAVLAGSISLMGVGPYATPAPLLALLAASSAQDRAVGLVDEVHVRFFAEGHVVITDLKIDYGQAISRLYPKRFIAEIKKRLLFRKGGIFPSPLPDGGFDEAAEALFERQRAQIVSLYVQSGYRGTRVRLVPTFHGVGNTEVSLRVIVDEGEQPEMGRVLLKGNRALSYAEVLSHISTGERADFWPGLFGAFGVGRYERRRLKEELLDLERRYRREGFVSARVRLREVIETQGQVVPVVEIHEGPRLVVEFEGNDHLKSGELRRVLTFESSGALDDTEIALSEAEIAARYQATARYFVQVRHERVQIGEVVYLTFIIDEGPRVYVRAVEFVGNKRLKDAEIEAVMETRGVAPDGVISTLGASAGVLMDARVKNDLVRVRDLYRERGMPAIRFRCAPTGTDVSAWTGQRLASLAGDGGEMGPAPAFRGAFDQWRDDPVNQHCFLVRPDEDARLVTLRIELDEGLQTTVDRLDLDRFIAGMDARMQDEAAALMQGLGFMDDLRRWRKGAGLNRRKLEAVRSFLLRYFGRHGYLEAKVDPVCLGGEEGVSLTRDCTEALLYGRHLEKVSFKTRPGRMTRVDGVLIRGNLVTEDAVILNELSLTIDGPLGHEELFRSKASLRSLGIFDAVNITPLSEEGAGDKRSVVLVTVEEGSYLRLEGYIGLQIDTAPIGTDELPVLYSTGLTYRHQNFLGKAFEVGVGALHANRLDTPQDLEGDSATFVAGPFLKNPRLLGSRLGLALDTQYRRAMTAQRDAYEEVFAAKATVDYDFYNLSYPADWGRGLRATLSNEYRRDRVRGLTRSGERPSFGAVSHSVGVKPELTWDRRDSPLHPTRGWLVSVASEAVFAASNEALLFDPSYKETLSAQYVQSFFKRRLILVPALRLGAVQSSLAGTDLKSGFFFKAGGDGVALPVRGYKDATIEACGGVPDDRMCGGVFDDDDEAHLYPLTVGGQAMALGSMEARFPTFIFDDLWFAAFVEGGAIAPTWGDMDRDRIFPAVGGGLRYLITGQIPFRLDVGYPLRATAFAPQEARLHLNIFYSL